MKARLYMQYAGALLKTYNALGQTSCHAINFKF